VLVDLLVVLVVLWTGLKQVKLHRISIRIGPDSTVVRRDSEHGIPIAIRDMLHHVYHISILTTPTPTPTSRARCTSSSSSTNATSRAGPTSSSIATSTTSSTSATSAASTTRTISATCDTSMWLGSSPHSTLNNYTSSGGPVLPMLASSCS
jgi:hypothetical protein